ncbi:beta-2-glycoprotein 1-like [Asterias amurensis]|uniref:beta-2-glycoprotein 1-like n=1 Tax=Asterias amurensis TaxID=7602 RepID=UPI003AB1420E
MSNRRKLMCIVSVVCVVVLSQVKLFTASPACDLPAVFPHAQCDQLAIGSESYSNCSCLPGYELTGTTAVPVGLLRCSNNGSWDGVSPVCIEVSCPDPPVPPHSVLSTPSSVVYTAGSVVTYACNAGYGVEGDTTSTCNANESWSELSLYCRPPCPTDSLQYQTSCFFIKEDELLGWDFARLKCEETSGHSLVKIDSVGLQSFLEVELLKRTSSSDFWIGGKEARPWVWENSKFKLCYVDRCQHMLRQTVPKLLTLGSW